MSGSRIWFVALVAALGVSVDSRSARASDDVVTDGFTALLAVNCSDVGETELLYTAGALSVSLRLAGQDEKLRHYDLVEGNYLNFPTSDGRCPVIEATICEKGGRVGVPLALFAPTGGVHEVTVNFDGVHVSLLAGDQMDDDMPTAKRCPVVWPADAKPRCRSPRVVRAAFESPVRKGLLPVPPDSAPIAGSPQYWTPRGFNAWVGDVCVGVWKGRFHVFYLYDRRHHASGAGAGRHYFAHLSSRDLVTWEEHPHAVPVERWWECVGTGTPFEYEGKLCLSYGLHSARVADRADFVTAHMDELPSEKRGEGRFLFSDLPQAVPVGGTYAESDDGIHFRKSGRYLTRAENPSICRMEDGGLGLATSSGRFFVSPDGRLGNWQEAGPRAPVRGDCPAPFSWGDRDYLLQGFYWMASRTKNGAWENWTLTGDDIYDGLNVPMVATWKGGRRILVGWIRHVHGWGGWLCFRELIRFPDGRLGIRWLPETPPPAEPAVFRVTDLGEPFVLRAKSRSGSGCVELRIDPGEARAQYTFPADGASESRVKTAAEIVSARPVAERFAKGNLNGDFAFLGGESAIGKIRGLDRSFEVKVVQHYDCKSDATIFDAEIAGTRTFVTRRAGRFCPMAPVDGAGGGRTAVRGK